MRWNDARRAAAWASLLLALLAGSLARATTVLETQGEASVTRAGVSEAAVRGFALQDGDELATAEGADLLLRFEDGARLALRGASRLRIVRVWLQGPPEQQRKQLALVEGGLRYLSGAATVRHGVSFETRTATVGIRGTDLEITVLAQPRGGADPGTYLRVNEGEAVLAANGASLPVTAGEVALGAAPPLVPRAPGLPRPAPARRLAQAPPDVFRSGALDSLLR